MIKAPFMALVIGWSHAAKARGQGKRQVARPGNDDLGGQSDLPGHRTRWPVCGLLRLEWDVMPMTHGRTALNCRAGPHGRLRRSHGAG